MSNDHGHKKGSKGHGEEDNPIEKWEKLRDKVDRIVDTTEHHHREAYASAVEEHLMDDEGEIDYKRLNDSETQKKFAEAMSNFYIKKAQKYFKSDDKLDDFAKDRLMSAYSGHTKSKLHQLASRYGEDFNFEVFDKSKQEFMDELAKQLRSAASSHIGDEHIEDIVKHTESEDIVNPDYMRREDAINLLEQFRQGGKIPPKTYSRALKQRGQEYILTDKYRRPKKTEDHEHKKAA